MTNLSGGVAPESEGREPPNRQSLQFDAFTLDSETGELRKSGRLVSLRPQPFKLLLLLANRPNQVVTREEIQKAALEPRHLRGLRAWYQLLHPQNPSGTRR